MSYSLKTLRKEKFRKLGIFHTPEKLAQYMKSFFPDDVAEIYDPTVGHGALISIFGDEVEKYGQDIEADAVSYCNENLTNFKGYAGDLLHDDGFKDKRFKYIIANPPYSTPYDPTGLEDDERFTDLPKLAPKSKADFMFLKHIIHHLTDDGMAVVLMFPGVLYRGNAEGKIRKYLVECNYIERVEEITGAEFDDTSINVVMLVIRKNKADDLITFKRNGKEEKHSIADVAENSFNLSPSHFVEEEIVKEQIDPYATEQEIRNIVVKRVRWSIAQSVMYWCLDPALNPHPNEFVARLKQVVNEEAPRMVEVAEAVNRDEIDGVTKAFDRICEIAQLNTSGGQQWK